MNVWFSLLLVLGGVTLVIVYRLIDRWNKKPIDFPYVKRSTLYNRAERKFLGYLVKAVGDEYFIMGKVRVADLISIEPSLSEKQRREAYQYICHERVDFVLTDRATTRLVATVELYQNKPNDARMIKRAQNLDKVFKLAGLPLIRFQENDYYRVTDIRHGIHAALPEPSKVKTNSMITLEQTIPIPNHIPREPVLRKELNKIATA